MRILAPIVLAQPLFVASRQSQRRLCRAVGAELVCHQNVGCEALFLEQISHEFHCRVLVASSLDQKIENLAFIVDRPPQPELFAANQDGHLVEMPTRSRPMAPTAKLPGEQRSEFQYPSQTRFGLDRGRSRRRARLERFGAGAQSRCATGAPYPRERRTLRQCAGSSNPTASAIAPAPDPPRRDRARPQASAIPPSAPRSPSPEICPPCPTPANQRKDGITASIRWPHK